MELGERFWSKVQLGLECWEWTAAKDPRGYGFYRVPPGVMRRPYRLAYEERNGPIPEGYEIDHMCRNPSCVRPDHLEAVTRRENVIRAPSGNARKTHCPRGHPYAGENLVRRKIGDRRCRRCHNEREAARWRAGRAS